MGKHEAPRAPIGVRMKPVWIGLSFVAFGLILAIVTSIVGLTASTHGVGTMDKVSAATTSPRTITNSAPPPAATGNEDHSSSPPVDRSSPRPPITTVTYTVVPGDNLTIIAEKFKAEGYQVLYQWNQTVIGQNPNLIKPGEVLIVSVSG